MFFALFFALMVFVFILLKCSLSSIALSDTNVYIAMADHLLHGKMLYKDMFLTNLPFFPYLSVLYLFISKSNLTFFYWTSIFEAALISIFIYLITNTDHTPRSIPGMTAGAYLFSMIVLATTDHQTGIFFATLMATLSYFFYHRKQYALAGILLGLMFVTKGYTLPILVAFGVYDIWKRKQKSWKLILPAIIVVFMVLLPSLIFARSQLVSNIVGYTLHRPTGLSKLNIFRFFAVNEWLFIAATIYAFFNARKNALLALILGLGILFLILYQDIYFFYIDMLMPFMCIALAEGVLFLSKKIGRLPGLLVGALLISFSMILNIQTYMQNLSKIGKIENITAITNIVKKQNPEQIFGAVEIVPVISYLTQIPLLNDIIDTNESLFTRKVYDLQTIKKSIYQKKTMVITLGADQNVYFPDGRTGNVQLKIIPEVFKVLDIEKHCHSISSTPIVAEGIINRINIWRCY